MYKIYLVLIFIILNISLLSAQNEQLNNIQTINDSLKILVENIQNSDIFWDGDDIGYMPRRFGGSSGILFGSSNLVKAIPNLTEALLDSQRFVAAHVLLTSLNTYVEIMKNGCYNGISMDIIEFKTPITEECLKRIYNRWEKSLKNEEYLLDNTNCISE